MSTKRGGLEITAKSYYRIAAGKFGLLQAGPVQYHTRLAVKMKIQTQYATWIEQDKRSE
jgi:hypothetical protein